MAFVAVTKIESGTGTSASSTVASTAGNALFAGSAVGNGSGTQSVSDGTNTWTTDLNNQLITPGDGIFLASAPNIAGGSHTTTLTASASTSGCTGFVLEYSGVATSAIRDVAATAGNNSGIGSTSVSTPSMTNVNAADVFISFMADEDGANPTTITETGTGWTVPTGGSELNGANFYPSAIAYKEVSSTGAQQNTWTITSSIWAAAICCYKMAAGGGSTAPLARRLVVLQAVNRAATY